MKRYLALGDSYTIGEGVEFDNNFPNQLVRALNNEGVNIGLEKLVATTGWTTQELLTAIEADSFNAPYDFVTLLIGVNNQYRQKNTDGYAESFEACLKKALSFVANDIAKVLVVSIPDYGVTPFGKYDEITSLQVDDYNRINRGITAKYNIAYADINPVSKCAKDDTSLLVDDQLHPSAKQYADWVAIILPTALELLN
ncbi:SGNH/GDSL hydrolase family protein [Polluticaenibacter yanchengensis]|uniref:SGNH/GDSL hydrolase family protein n=1 Tax=Polluticaenibacter yanchengensis TaxID=3014562 RepID=A0ABT4UKQ6_9BACT|nr:SGNH/GDSL hydrolase family protein [Chitinophagaceae bacterium LY-5]